MTSKWNKIKSIKIKANQNTWTLKHKTHIKQINNHKQQQQLLLQQQQQQLQQQQQQQLHTQNNNNNNTLDIYVLP